MFHFHRTSPILVITPFYFPDYAKIVGAGAALLVTFAWLSAGVVGPILASAPIVSIDQKITSAVRALASPPVLEMMTWLSRVHGTAGIMGLSALLVAWLAWRKKHEILPVLLASVPCGLLLNFAVKNAVQRARPDTLYVAERLSSYSFPSGHTAGATLIYGFLLILLWPHCPSALMRTMLIAIAVSLVVLVAASRIMLGMHYPSDCATAVAGSVLWLALCAGAARSVPK